jgi:hypothetical protein
MFFVKVIVVSVICSLFVCLVSALLCMIVKCDYTELGEDEEEE